MPLFPKGVPVGLSEFAVRVPVHDDGLALDMSFHFVTVDAGGQIVGRFSGDLTPYLTAAQITNFTTVILALFAKARTDTLT